MGADMRLVINPSEMSQWYTLVVEAESTCSLNLHQDVESYLVFLLIRFTREPSIVESVLAIDFLKNLNSLREHRYDALRDVGDKCLLFSGLFPKRAERFQLTPDYFMSLGRSAYDTLSFSHEQKFEYLYSLLSNNFESLTDVMHAMRDIDKEFQETINKWHSHK